MQTKGMDFETAGGTLRNIPAPLLGWVVVGFIAIFLVWSFQGDFNSKLDTIVRNGDRQNATLEKILEAVKK